MYSQVIARGLVLLSSSLAVRGGRATISIPTTAAMAPKAKLVVSGVRGDNNEVVVDAVDFDVKGLFQNEVRPLPYLELSYAESLLARLNYAYYKRNPTSKLGLRSR